VHDGAMDVTEDLVRQVARLARLDLTEEEVRRTVPQLARILAHVERLPAVDLAGHDPATQPPVPFESLREDEPGVTLPRHEVLRNAPRHDGSFFVVPKILEES
jgi:aspartyl-tRNA(Asn)/glutamyl-tRNA(Gln) amidotransferase subunit C